VLQRPSREKHGIGGSVKGGAAAVEEEKQRESTDERTWKVIRDFGSCCWYMHGNNE